MPEQNLKQFVDELKKQSKRDVNDFFREESNGKIEFVKLMKEARTPWDLLISALPEKGDPGFVEALDDVLALVAKQNEFVQAEVVSNIQSLRTCERDLVKKRLQQAITGAARAPREGEQVPLGARLIRHFVTRSGVGVTPQVPISRIVDEIHEDMIEHGYKFITDKSTNTVFMDRGDGKLIAVEHGDVDFGLWALEAIQLSTTKKEPVKDIVFGMMAKLRTAQHSRQVERIEFSKFLSKHNAMAFPTGNARQELIVVFPSKDGSTPDVRIVQNGLNEWNLFLLPPPMQQAGNPIQYLGPNDTQAGFDKMRQYLHDFQALGPECKLRSFTHKMVMACPFPLRRRMRKANRGQQGSGKTTDAEVFTAFYYGRPSCGAFSDEKELWAAAHYNPIQVLDNWESLKKKAQEEFALLHATGGTKTFRKLFTDRTMLEYAARSHLIETAIEGFSKPEAREREQVYDYMIEHQTSVLQSDVEDGVGESRDLMWTALLNGLSLHVLPQYAERLREYQEELRKISHPKKRFNDFIAHQLMIADLVRPYWRDVPSVEILVKKWTSRWIAENYGESIVSDPAIVRLEAILVGENKRCSAFASALLLGVTSNKLYVIFSEVEKELGLPRAFDSAANLAQRLPSTVKAWNKTLGNCVSSTVRNVKTYHFSIPGHPKAAVERVQTVSR